jgi:L-fuculose-phosphate aldolase
MDPGRVPAEQLEAFIRAGSALLACRCNNSHSGNLSVRLGDEVLITRTGAMLGSLTADDLVTTALAPTDAERRRASTELDVHLAIYAGTPHTAIAHGHALDAVLVGWMVDQFHPIDLEGAYYFGEIPIVECVPATASPVLGQALAAAMASSPVVIVRGHGVFAAADRLERAAQWITSVNDSARLFVEAARSGLDTAALAARPYLEQARRKGAT